MPSTVVSEQEGEAAQNHPLKDGRLLPSKSDETSSIPSWTELGSHWTFWVQAVTPGSSSLSKLLSTPVKNLGCLKLQKDVFVLGSLIKP